MAVQSDKRAPLHSSPSFEQARTLLVTRLHARRAEIEQAVITRAFAVSQPTEANDPEYLDGLRTAISAAVGYALAIIERGEEHAPSPPPTLFTQARLAAHFGVGLDTVLRRYSAGYVLLSDFVLDEAEQSGFRGAALQRLLRWQAALDRLLAAVSEEYARAASERPGTSEQRRADRIERLLDGELLDTSELAYDFEGVHIAVIASGQGSLEALRELASTLDCRLLTVRRDASSVWAWFGRRRTIDGEELCGRAAGNLSTEIRLAFGEPAPGLPGWCLSHRQARAALAVARRSGEPLVRYADVALLASVLRDDLLITSLRKMYLEPLETGRDGGDMLRETLRAYFSTRRNVSSAAALLGLNRSTVTYRLQAIEDRLQRPLDRCMAELEALIRLEGLKELS